MVNNNAGNGDTGLAALLAAGQVRKMICSFPRQSDSYVFDGLYRAGKIELELVPQGNLAERMRAAGAGIGAFYGPTGVGTPLAEGKEQRTIDGRDYVLEYPIEGDVALIGAYLGDRMGNLVYRKTARNFGPVMATAAALTIAEVHRVVEIGQIDPEVVVTPGIFVDRILDLGRDDPPKEVREMSMIETSAAVEHLDRGPRSKDELAAAVAAAIPPGSYVNLGIGQPTTVADFLTPESGVVLQTENGMLNMGPAARPDQVDPDLINAGKIPVTELPGASYFHHADSFAMMRGGHLDVCVLGAFQVSEGGDLATRFPSLPAASQSGSDHTARLRLQAWQPIMNPAERSRMRLKLRLALRLGWRDRGVNLNAVVMEAVGKEHWDRSHDPREAMVGGLARSGRVIFAAAAP